MKITCWSANSISKYYAVVKIKKILECDDCNARYIGQTGRKLEPRMKEHTNTPHILPKSLF